MITGHRPQKLPCRYDETHPFYSALYDKLLDIVQDARIYAEDKGDTLTLMSGMALGVDTMFAEIAVVLDIPFIAAVPCTNQDSRWNKQSQTKYRDLLSKAQKVVTISIVYDNSCMQKRNEYMVDNSDYAIAVWDGSSGGTKNCIDYLKKKQKPIKYVRIKN
jgi:uncharacterized phage-like protein YoqJ